MTATVSVLHEVVLPKLEGIRPAAGGYSAKCPAHDDSSPSLSVKAGDNQPVVFHCFAGCSQDDILAALGLTWEDVSAPREERRRDTGEWTFKGPASDVYNYCDEYGELLYQVLRVPEPGGKKTFLQRVPDASAKGGYRWKLDGVRRVPYRLPEVMTAIAEGREVWVVEGEKDVHTLARMGLTATCNSGGAGKWKLEHSALLTDAHVRIVADRDKPGQAHARAVADSLEEFAASVSISEPTAGKDITDHIAAGKTIDDLVITWQREQAPRVDLAPDLHEFLSVVDPPRVWVVPGLLERGDRLIWTGFEGTGKTVAVRMIAVAAAAGVHPFTEERFPPQRVLYIDCENSERQGRRHFRGLEETAREKMRPVPDGGMFLIHRPAGIDLSRAEDAAWLLERVTAHKPDLLVCGPFYRLHAADSEEEAAARKVVQALDAARVLADCALIVEHHAPHGGNGSARALRPFGSSLLMRWPEMGMGIAPVTPEETPCRHVHVKPWRGNRDERNWPKALQWGVKPDDWPWVDPELQKGYR